MLITCVVAMLPILPGLAQEYASFNMLIEPDYVSAERTLELYQGLSGHPADIASLRGSQIAVATTALLTQQPLNIAMLEKDLEAAKFNQSLGADAFRMKEARQNLAAIKELLVESQRRNFGQRVVGTVEQLFPPSARINAKIPLYFVAFGHQNIDAYVRRVIWHGNTPTFVGEGEGELTIVVNLAKAVSYGRSADERFVGMLGVVAHEVFHAAFGVYKDTSPAWRAYYANRRSYLDRLFDLTQNEGIAYYLSLVQRTRGKLTPEWEQNARAAFSKFNAYAGELCSANIDPHRAEEIIRLSNTSGFWESYGAVTGMIIARQLDQSLGRNALVETIAQGPAAFFGRYTDLMKQDTNLPPLSPLLVAQIASMRR